MSPKKFHKSILSPEQVKLFPLLRAARRSGYYLVGGTAIALHLGHRISIDFDLFHKHIFSPKRIDGIMERGRTRFSQLLVARDDEVTGIVAGVKVTFFAYPFDIHAVEDFEGIIQIPDLLTLGAMKAYALGRRAKWKDYVDLYFIFQHFSLSDISKKAKTLFSGSFNEKLFREQLHYFDNINREEVVDYILPCPPSDREIQGFLEKISLS